METKTLTPKEINNVTLDGFTVVKVQKIRESEETEQHEIKVTYDFTGTRLTDILHKAVESYVIKFAGRVRKLGDVELAKLAKNGTTVVISEFFTRKQAMTPMEKAKRDIVRAGMSVEEFVKNMQTNGGM